MARAWQTLDTIEDPEIPALSIVDLGLVRFIRRQTGGALEVGISPTYSGCPATAVIKRSVEQALRGAEIGDFIVSQVLSPAWSSDWISEAGRHKLGLYGIVPPERSQPSKRGIFAVAEPVGCPRCQSIDTECISEFGSTPCKALHRCRTCLEPFESFKCI
jgi:ring-1,2-phenylacetyl-CoA epoxidase subunit PaaD